MTTPFYEQIEAKTKAAIEENFNLIKNLHDYRDQEPSVFEKTKEDMLRGAEIVLLTLQSDGLSRQGTRSWVDKMTEEQLEVCIEQATFAKKRLAERGFIDLYELCGRATGTKFFISQSDARQAFLEAAKEEAAEKNVGKCALEINKRHFSFSEVKEAVGQECAEKLFTDNPDLVVTRMW
ncbi:hypothetical protein ACKC9G_18365 [Pokkaliibacter sp. CJK22405]|uniref:hypothetical protein n=1 Tax=Pokkaliibacter sp. CJK22405 TaxID=3384615 RepID=UPI0039849A2D